MTEIFKKKINELYDIILQPIDNVYKLVAIKKYKKLLCINGTFGEEYYNKIKRNKEKGVVYTPEYIVKYIVKNTIKVEDLIKNPYLKIVDPSCGCGNIIIFCYKYIKKLFVENLSLINEKNNLNLGLNNIDEHILFNNLYGFDIDELALKILIIELFQLSGCVNKYNFLNKDFLLKEFNEKFDVFIGNPPYVGHKSINKEYSILLKKIYKGIYKDKGDLSYCFFQKALSVLNKKGKLTFITSRYFLESLSGENLRKVLKDICSLYKIVDFYGIRPFKSVGIDPIIIFLINEQNLYENIEIIKPIRNKWKMEKEFCDSLFMNRGNKYDKFFISKNNLNNKGWILRNDKERNIIRKIEEKSFTNLNNICYSFQGIITGCDKAFVVNSAIISDENLEKDIIKPWIKSTFIHKNNVKRQDSFIIYSDLIKDPTKYPNIIKHIEIQKEKLINRRECKRGVRLWYELQWGRNPEIFESNKIIFPFKASSNRFAIDQGSYFSADVYSLVLKDNVPFTYEYLIYLLNSKIYDFYFKTFAKKLGGDLFEYYPNNLMKLCIPTMTKCDYNDENYLYKFFEFTREEINIIKNFN